MARPPFQKKELKMEEEARPVLFVCDKFPMLTLIYKRDTTLVVNGEIVRTPMESIGFIKTPYGGHYETNDPLKIAFVKSSPQFKDGTIVMVENIEEMRKREKQPESNPVTQGGIGTMAREPVVATPVPVAAGEHQPAAAATVPGRKKAF